MDFRISVFYMDASAKKVEVYKNQFSYDDTIKLTDIVRFMQLLYPNHFIEFVAV